MNWYLQSSESSDVVKSTRIRFSRNINGFKFNLKDKQDIENLENKIKDALYQIGYGLKFLKLKDMDEITKMSLVEKNLISPDFVLNKNDIGSILINDEENICIMIGNAVNKKYGYLTSCPNNCRNSLKSICNGTFTSTF